MDKTELENIILKKFYQLWEKNGGCALYDIHEKMTDVEEKFFTRVAEELEENNLINGADYALPSDITGFGVLEAEQRGLINSEVVIRYETIRYEMLKAAAKAREIDGRYGEAEAEKIIAENNFSANEFHNNQRVLYELGLVNEGGWRFSITTAGLAYFVKQEQQKNLREEFNKVSELQPQKRGIELQKIIAKALEFAGWEQEESVKTSYEEVDITIHKNREFYLIECKWEKATIQPIAINHLLSKLNKRADTNGIVMSMSGFTKGAVQNVEDSTNQKLILLFGKEDTEEIISNPDSFEDLLNEKYKELVMRRKAIWK